MKKEDMPKQLMFLYGPMEQEIIVEEASVRTILIPAAGHEAGHGVVAHHYGARVIGIAIGFIPARQHQGMLFHAIYEHRSDWSTETQCVVKAAGPAADLLFRGEINEQAASGDLHDIADLTGTASLEPYLSKAKDILIARRKELARITAALRQKLLKAEERYLVPMSEGRVGALLLDESELMQYWNLYSSSQ
jgi:hypothetical protein